MKNSNQKKSLAGYIFLLIFIVLLTGILAGGYFAYRNYEQNYRMEVEQQLSATADLKVDQLVQWRKERLGDANVFYKNGVFSDLVKRYFKNSNDADAIRRIQAWMGQISSAYTYNRVSLHDPTGIERISFPEGKIQTSSIFSVRSAEVLKSGKVEFLDFYRDENDKKVYLTIFVPILDESNNRQVLGILALRIDPAEYLYPMIEKWPTPSKTSETLIVRRDGDDALFLNELRFQKNSALNFRIPLSKTNTPAVKAALGQEGIVEGIDYRGEQVIAMLRSIPASPWFLIARIDISEVYTPIRERLYLMIILVSALLIGSGTGVSLVWRHQRNRFYREQYQSAEALQESELRLRRAVSNAPFPIMIHAEDSEVVMISNSWTEITGYTHADIPTTAAWTEKAYGLRKHLVQEDIDRLYGLTEKVYEGNYEVMTASGNRRTWEFMSAPLGVLPDGRRMAISMAMDITERKQAEEKLRASRILFSSAFVNSPLLMTISDMNTGKYLEVNNSFCRVSEFSSEEAIGKTSIELGWISKEERARLVYELKQHGHVAGLDLTLRSKSGKTVICRFSGDIVKTDEGDRLFSIAEDITESRQAEEKLRETNEYLDNLFNHANAPIIVWDPSLVITRFNHAFEQLSGIPAEEVIGKKIDVLFPKEKRDTSLELIKRAVSGERWETVEIEIQQKDGESRIVLWNSANILDKDGKDVVATIAQGYDITERKRAEQALESQHSLLTALINSPSEIIIFSLDKNYCYTTFNEKHREEMKKVWNVDIKIGMNLLDCMSIPELRALAKQSMDLALKGEAFLEEQHQPEQNTYYEFSWNPIFQNNEVVGITVFIRNITERKRMEEALRESEIKFRQTFDVSPVGIVMVGLDKKFLRCNNAFSHSLGYLSEELVGKTFEDVTLPEDKHIGMAEMKAIIKDEINSFHLQKRYVRKGGQAIWSEVTVTLVRDSEKRPQYFVAIIQDITERKTAEEALRESESSLQAVLQSTADGILSVDSENNVLFANDRFYEMWKIPSEIISNTDDAALLQFVINELIDPQSFLQRVQDLYKSEEESFDTLYFKDGRIFERLSHPLMQERKLNGRVWSFRDVTERKRAEEALRLSEKRLHELNVLQGALLQPNPIEQKLKFVTESVVQTLGADFARIWIIKPGDRCESGCIHAQVTEGPHICRFRDRCLHLLASSGRYTHTNGKDHGRVPFGCYKIGKIAAGEETKFLTNEVTIDPLVHDHAWAKELGLVSFAGYRLIDIDGTPIGVLALFGKRAILPEEDLLLQGITHITSQVLHSALAEEALSKSEENFRNVFEHASVGKSITSVDGRIKVNKAFCNIMGYTEEELSKSKWQNITHLDDIEQDQKIINSIISGDRDSARWQKRYIHKKGNNVWVDISTVLQRDSAGKPMYFITTVNDITELKRQEKELQDKNDELARFTYTVSHDLKSPLVTVKTFLGYLEQDTQKQDAERILKDMMYIRNAAEKMSSLLDELLELSRVGRKMNPYVEVPLQILVQEVLDIVAGQITERGVKIKVTKEPIVLLGDRPRLIEVFQNLLDNAVKFMGDQKSPLIEIGVKHKDKETILFVRDNGIGIDPRYQSKLFGLFEKLDSNTEGTGIGLALVQRIVEVHGGKIWIESDGIGKGTTVRFTLAGMVKK